MSERVCLLEGRDEALVAYLYDDLEPAARRAFEDHVDGCSTCRTELVGLRGVRADLARWTPPEPARVLAFDPMPRRRPRLWAALADVPVWVQVAAALIVLGVSLRAANLELRVDREGFTVRTGLSAPAAEQLPRESSAAAATPSVAQAPWRADLAALEQSMRAEMQTIGLQPRPDARRTDDDALMRRVRALIEVSERNQRRELALRVAEMARDVQAQRNADLQRIQRGFTVLETATTGEIAKQQRVLNNLATWASQRQ